MARSKRESVDEANSKIDVCVGKVLRGHRVARDITQEQLAWNTGVERAFISQIERGVKGASVKMLFRLCEGLDVDPVLVIEEIAKCRKK